MAKFTLEHDKELRELMTSIIYELNFNKEEKLSYYDIDGFSEFIDRLSRSNEFNPADIFDKFETFLIEIGVFYTIKHNTTIVDVAMFLSNYLGNPVGVLDNDRLYLTFQDETLKLGKDLEIFLNNLSDGLCSRYNLSVLKKANKNGSFTFALFPSTKLTKDIKNSEFDRIIYKFFPNTSSIYYRRPKIRYANSWSWTLSLGIKEHLRSISESKKGKNDLQNKTSFGKEIQLVIDQNNIQVRSIPYFAIEHDDYYKRYQPSFADQTYRTMQKMFSELENKVPSSQFYYLTYYSLEGRLQEYSLDVGSFRYRPFLSISIQVALYVFTALGYIVKHEDHFKFSMKKFDKVEFEREVFDYYFNNLNWGLFDFYTILQHYNDTKVTSELEFLGNSGSTRIYSFDEFDIPPTNSIPHELALALNNIKEEIPTVIRVISANQGTALIKGNFPEAVPGRDIREVLAEIIKLDHIIFENTENPLIELNWGVIASDMLISILSFFNIIRFVEKSLDPIEFADQTVGIARAHYLKVYLTNVGSEIAKLK